MIEGTWVLGMVEDRQGGNLMMVPCSDNKRDAQTLTNLITEYIREGTVIVKDETIGE